ncbi:MerR family transcriptional regulator [Tundrisphaera sp. TA3]|uniref:MerR family transcriptional regulator n=1 Tax=Tundrisphaera sp. TA3 TaxID=3435775 RepID=UPI003EB70106
MAAASRLLTVNISTLKFWCDRKELKPDAIVGGKRRFRRETLEKLRERIEYVERET